MADKISTVVLNVDLECDRCYKKIRRVLCRIQDKANIKTISYDEKNNAVMVSGPFDADKVCKKLCCKAGRVIKDMQIKGKENKGGKDSGDKAKPAEKEAGGGKADKKDAGGDKAEKKDGGKPEKEAKADKATAAKPEKAEKVAKDAKPEKKVKFDLEDAPAAAAATAKPGKVPFPAGMTQADLAPLLEKLKIAKQQQQQAGPEPPRGEPIAPPMMMVPPVPAAQGVAVPSIWPAPAGSVSCYSYNPAYDHQYSYYGGGGYGYGYGCGGGGGACRCGACAGGNKAPAAGGYYGVAPAAAPYDHQGWYYGNRQPYYQQQQCYEDPNAGCSVM